MTQDVFLQIINSGNAFSKKIRVNSIPWMNEIKQKYEIKTSLWRGRVNVFREQ